LFYRKSYGGIVTEETSVTRIYEGWKISAYGEVVPDPSIPNLEEDPLG
jgi:hypothetical protein